ncbi:MAG: YncE family protein [Pseudomonadota bacterium]|nr:YncE family protein [Pseudomonadota bacterium]
MKRSIPLFAALALVSVAQAGSPPVSSYALAHSYALGGPGHWDYLTFDAPGNRLFIARDDRVMVVNPDSGRLLGEVHGLKHAHGVALSDDGKMAYVSNGAGDDVSVVDTSTLAVTHTIPVSGHDPDAILLEPASGHVWAMNGHSNSISVIDPAQRKEVASIALPGNPEFAVSDAHGHVYVNLEDISQLADVDTHSNRLLHTWSLAPCEGPTGLAMDPAHSRLFSVCANGWLIVTDAYSGARIAKVRIGKHPDAVAFDPATQLVLSTAGATGELDVVRELDPDHYRLVDHPKTMQGARTLALDPRNHRVFTVGAKQASRDAPVEGFTLLELEPGH